MLYFEITKEFFFLIKVTHTSIEEIFFFISLISFLAFCNIVKDTILSARTKNDRYSGDSL